MIDVIEN